MKNIIIRNLSERDSKLMEELKIALDEKTASGVVLSMIRTHKRYLDNLSAWSRKEGRMEAAMSDFEKRKELLKKEIDSLTDSLEHIRQSLDEENEDTLMDRYRDICEATFPVKKPFGLYPPEEIED